MDELNDQINAILGKHNYYAYLDGDNNVVVTNDLLEWNHHFCNDDRTLHHFRDKNDDLLISTVFLGINHGFGNKPLWFETMAFYKSYDGFLVCRYATYDEAIAGHDLIVGTWKDFKDTNKHFEHKHIDALFGKKYQ